MLLRLEVFVCSSVRLFDIATLVYGAVMTPLHGLLVAVIQEGTWVKEHKLPIPPFPGLGIRLDTYQMVNVVDVVVGDVNFDVTCIVGPEKGETLTPTLLERLGFECAPYP